MPRNNKRKKKLSNFKKFLCIYCGILLLAGVITLIMLHSLLKDYEEGMPSGAMDKIVNQFTPDGIGKLLSDNKMCIRDSYGTGAIMAVPAHDERDWEFAKKFNLPIIQVVAKNGEEVDVNEAAFTDVATGVLINSRCV